MENDPANGTTDSWARDTWSALLRMGQTAIDNATNRGTQAPTTTGVPAQNQSWLSKLDAKTVVLGLVALVAVVLVLRKL
jgi:hypothetical protein